MTVAIDDFLRRIRALVAALALLQRSQPDSAGYAEFRRKLEKCVRLVLDTADELLRDVLGAADTVSRRDVLGQALAHGLLSAEESERWSGYFDLILPADGVAYAEDTLVRLRSFLLDARSLESTLRGA